MMTDPIADMLTRIRNSNSIYQPQVSMPASKLRVAIAQVLTEEGFVASYNVEPSTPGSTLTIDLKYGIEGEKVIRHIERISKPGCRVYAGVDELKPVLRGQGIHVVSTPKGVLSDRKAREMRVGGEVLAQVY
ncbi:MAG: 30S ribosomal protein S8 [Planctomycetota bacterium]|jgi:small subunit ribosomal protein S8|nr:30S ribosomal protein S8 [Planctomycetota bacterium]MDP6937678.1 30S ribosomal protein S8 [Planctomycetota bacterium]HJM58700.1 30S ribosomal protein S8 [Planctomycetota bacterium]